MKQVTSILYGYTVSNKWNLLLFLSITLASLLPPHNPMNFQISWIQSSDSGLNVFLSIPILVQTTILSYLDFVCPDFPVLLPLQCFRTVASDYSKMQIKSGHPLWLKPFNGSVSPSG